MRVQGAVSGPFYPCMLGFGILLYMEIARDGDFTAQDVAAIGVCRHWYQHTPFNVGSQVI